MNNSNLAYRYYLKLISRSYGWIYQNILRLRIIRLKIERSNFGSFDSKTCRGKHVSCEMNFVNLSRLLDNGNVSYG